jgi:hypothetical protein
MTLSHTTRRERSGILVHCRVVHQYRHACCGHRLLRVSIEVADEHGPKLPHSDFSRAYDFSALLFVGNLPYFTPTWPCCHRLDKAFPA